MPHLKRVVSSCHHLGCNEPRAYRSSFCEKHSPKSSWRPNPYSGISSWEAKRKLQMRMQPLCEGCKVYGRATEAFCVDHVWAWKQLDRTAFMVNWFQSLCQSCHSRKTTLESKGIFLYFPTLREYSLDDYWEALRRTKPQGLVIEDDPNSTLERLRLR